MTHALPVLMYHAIDDVRSPLAVPAHAFVRTMQELAHEGWRTVTDAEIAGGLARGEWPDRTFAIHFDDGFRSVKEKAWPVLRDLGFGATIFVVAGFVGRDNGWPGQPAHVPRWPLMTWREIETLAADGAAIGAHTVTHVRLPRLNPGAQAHEIASSFDAIERAIGKCSRAFAYPYGEHDASSRRVAMAHADAAFTTRLASAAPDDAAEALPRIDACYLGGVIRPTRLDRAVVRAYLAARRAGRAIRARL